MASHLSLPRPPREGTILVLLPLTERSQQILGDPANQNRVCQVPGRDTQGQENAVGLEVSQSPGPGPGTILTFGRVGSHADIQLPSSSVATVQCSIRSLGHGEYMLVDNSKGRSTRTYGQNAIAFAHDAGVRQVLIDRDFNLEFGFGGAYMDLYKFGIVWHGHHGRSWPAGYGTLRSDPAPEEEDAMNEWAPYGRRASTRIPRDIGRDIQFVFRDWLGTGAFGRVYRVLDVHTGRDMALKHVFRSRPGTAQWRAIKREVDALRRCEHPHILKYHRCQLEGSFAFIFTALAQGSVLDLVNAGEFARNPGLADQLRHQMLSALACLHDKGLVHRDVKPANVLYTKPAGKYIFILADFGLAVDANIAQTNAGSPLFQAPELRERPPCVSRSADVWSLFVTIAYVLDAGSLRTTPCGIQSLPLRIKRAATDPRIRLFANMAHPDPMQRPSAAALLEIHEKGMDTIA